MQKPEIEQITAAEHRIIELLPLFGHRNWIVIADSAYPAQSRPGIETQVAEVNHLRVVRMALEVITASLHVRPRVYVDSELELIAENDAPGVADFRRELDVVIGNRQINHLPHEEIIARLDEAAKVFRVLIVKTDMTIPYTSVFIELDCG